MADKLLWMPRDLTTKHNRSANNTTIIMKEVMCESLLKLAEVFFQNTVFHVFSSIADTF